ncbi:MAG: hypothetical protein K6G18_09955 [Treponema sp.]|nr:hypothetical protein [Treponema sp.]
MRKLHLLISLVALFLIAFPAFGQISVDPNDDFYEYAQAWEIRGLVKTLPPVRPYSLNSIKNILQQVIKRGTRKDVELAIEYWNEISGRPMRVEFEAKGKGKLSRTSRQTDDVEQDVDKLLWGRFALAGDSYVFPNLVSIGYDLGVLARSKENELPFLPYYTNSRYDSIQDPARLGPLYGYIDMNASASIGTNEFFAQAGVNRTGYGPFQKKGLALNETGYHSGNISYSIVKDKFSFVQQYSVIGATRSYDGSGLEPEKFLAFHALEYKFTPKFSASYYESIVYGRRFDLSYFLPVPFMVAQGLGGNSDNTQLGLLFKYKPFSNLMWATDLFVDDFDVNALVKGNLDSKNRFALQTGLIYAPENSFCRKVSLVYTAVAPYTYSHWDYDGSKSDKIVPDMYNYQNYTNNGIPIGTAYAPNSDSIEFNLDFKPTQNLRIGVGSSLMRHANIAESLSDEEAVEYLSSKPSTYATDGSIFEHSMFSGGDHVESAWDSLNFLNQENKMYVVQAKFDLDWTVARTAFGSFTLNVGNVFQYTHNKGVDSQLYPGCSLPASASYADKKNVLHAARDAWKSGFRDELADYVFIGFTYKF